MKRNLGLVLVAAIAFAFVGSLGADEGQVSDAALAELGLGGMQKMSDKQGEQIRGKWFYSTLPGSTALNTYLQLNATGGARIPVVQFHPGTGTKDPAFIIPPNFENLAAHNYRIAFEQANINYLVQYPTGIPGTNFGPGATQVPIVK